MRLKYYEELKSLTPAKFISIIHKSRVFNECFPPKYAEIVDAIINNYITTKNPIEKLHSFVNDSEREDLDLTIDLSVNISEAKSYSLLKNLCSPIPKLKRYIISAPYYCGFYKVDNAPFDNVINYIKKKFMWSNEIFQHNQETESILSVLALPAEIEIKSNEILTPLLNWLSSLFKSKRHILIPVSELLDRCQISTMNETRVMHEVDDIIIDGLNKLGYNLCPNYRIDGHCFTDYTEVIIYKNKSDNDEISIINRINSFCKERISFGVRSRIQVPQSIFRSISLSVEQFATILTIAQVAGIISQPIYYSTTNKNIIYQLIVSMGFCKIDAEYYSNLYHWLSLHKHPFSVSLQRRLADVITELVDYKSQIYNAFHQLSLDVNGQIIPGKAKLISKISKIIGEPY
jgi:hypothetical protein